MKESEIFNAGTAHIEFRNASEGHSYGVIVIRGIQFKISSDTATYHELLSYYRLNYPIMMRGIYDARPVNRAYFDSDKIAESMCSDIISSIKRVWGNHGGNAEAAATIGVDGSEIVNAIMEVIDRYRRA